MEQVKIFLWFFYLSLLLVISVKLCLAKSSFFPLESCQNRLKCVFAKHPLKKTVTKNCQNKQNLKYFTQNKTKQVDPKTLVQL